MKRFIAAAIAFALTVTAFAGMTVARAEEPAYPTAGESVTVVSDSDNLKSAFSNGGTIQLGSNIEVAASDTLTVSKDLYLDINGHTLTLNADRAISVKANITLTDTQQSGKLRHTGNECVLRFEGGNKNINIENVKIESDSTNTSYGVMFYAASNVNLRIFNAEIAADKNTSNRNIVISSNTSGNTLTMGGDDTYVHFGSTNGPYGADGRCTITVTGGRYSFDPSGYIDTVNYSVTSSNGTWTVTSNGGETPATTATPAATIAPATAAPTVTPAATAAPTADPAAVPYITAKDALIGAGSKDVKTPRGTRSAAVSTLNGDSTVVVLYNNSANDLNVYTAFDLGTEVQIDDTIKVDLAISKNNMPGYEKAALYVLSDAKYAELKASANTASYWDDFTTKYADYLIPGSEKTLASSTSTQSVGEIRNTTSTAGHLILLTGIVGLQSGKSQYYVGNISVKVNGEWVTPSISAPEISTPVPTSAPVVTTDLGLDNVFTSNMIFQRNKPIKVSGTGKNGDTVEVLFKDESARTVIKGGRWEVQLPPMDVVRSADMTIAELNGGKATDTITLTNVAVGDVIVMSGQSNMFRTVSGFRLESEADKDYPDIRLFSANQTENGWQPATIDNAKAFSATGFLTGKRIYNSANGEIPIGLIRAAYDGSNTIAWVNNSAFADDPDLYSIYSSASSRSTWHNQYLKPVQKLNVGAVMWYQGEGNTWYINNSYEKEMTMLIESWREEWNDPALPFAIVQLPTADFSVVYSNRKEGPGVGAGVRDGQWQVSQKMDNVTTIITIDTGRANEIHPNDKQKIADRGAKVLEHYLFGSNEIYQSPSYESMTIGADGRAVIKFKDLDASDKLISKDGAALRGFTAADGNGAFNDVSAEIGADGRTVIVNTKGLADPQIRYAWSDAPAVDDSAQKWSNINLLTESGFTVAPFRTDTGKYAIYFTDDTGKIVLNGTSMHDQPENTTAYICNYVPWVRDIEATDTPSGGTAEITIKAEDVDGTVETVEVFVDDESRGYAVKSGDMWVINVAGLSDGLHSVYAVATDNDNAKSNKQDGSMGSTTERNWQKRKAFLVGADANHIETAGTGYSVSSASPVEIPVGGAANNGLISLEASVYAENSGTVSFDAVTSSGTASLLSFNTANNRLSVGAAGYYVLSNIASNAWHRVKLELDVYSGTFSLWVDGVKQYNNQTWISRDKFTGNGLTQQSTAYQILKQGISTLKITSTSGATAYVDDLRLALPTNNEAVTFTETGESSFDGFDDDPYTAHLYNVSINAGGTYKIGASAGEETKYLETPITGVGTSIIFGVLAKTAVMVTPVYEIN